MGDVKHVNVAMHSRNPDGPGRPAGSRWVFEKTIHQNYHEEVSQGRGIYTQRIIHLFALVSQDRRILEVHLSLA